MSRAPCQSAPCCAAHPLPRLKHAAELVNVYRALADETRLADSGAARATARSASATSMAACGCRSRPISRHLAYLRQVRPGRGAARRHLDALPACRSASPVVRQVLDSRAARAHARRSRDPTISRAACSASWSRHEDSHLRVRPQRRALADGGRVFQRAGRSDDRRTPISAGTRAGRSRSSRGRAGDARGRNRSERRACRSASPMSCRRRSRAVTMGCGESCPVVPGVKLVEWQSPIQRTQPLESVRTIRDDLRHLVTWLIDGEV